MIPTLRRSAVSALVLLLAGPPGSAAGVEPATAPGPRSGTAERVAADTVAADTLAADTADADSLTDRAASSDTVAAVPSDAFRDATARRLLSSARARWLERKRSIRSYEALIRQRLGVDLRTPLKDRNIYRAEAATRVHWSADSTVVVQVLGARQEHPGGTEPPDNFPGFVEEVFDPGSDRMYFGFTDEDDGRDDGDDVWIEHPVAPGSEAHYRYRSGDTLTLSLPDGRSLRALELEFVPRRPSVHRIAGSLWIEPDSGALVRVVYRLSRTLDLERDTDAFDEDPDADRLPGIFRPVQFDVSLVMIEYSLWSFRYWLPRRLRFEGQARAGILTAPGAYEISYRILDVSGAEEAADSAADRRAGSADAVAERWTGDGRYGAYEEVSGDRENEGREIRILLPVERERLHTSEDLPPPIWDDAPGFAGEGELRALYDELAGQELPVAASGADLSLHWGLQRPGLVRYNRVEGLSVGARAELAVGGAGGPFDATATARLGLGTWVPDVGLEAGWETSNHRLALSGYHRVAEVDPRARNLGPGNSATALFFGRDDGDYYRATGASLEWSPTGAGRPWYGVTLSAQSQGALEAASGFSVSELLGGDDEPFRPALAAEEAAEYSAALRLEPWWGVDPRAAQFGLEVLLQGAVGDFRWLRSRVVGRTAAPLPGGLRLGLEAGGGTLWGDAPAQRHWFLGGTRTLRGYAGSAAVGTSYLRGRLELARELGALRVSAFSDAGWAGSRDAFSADDGLLSAGLGASALDGLVRVDVARALRAPTGWRLELYLDALL